MKTSIQTPKIQICNKLRKDEENYPKINVEKWMVLT